MSIAKELSKLPMPDMYKQAVRESNKFTSKKGEVEFTFKDESKLTLSYTGLMIDEIAKVVYE